MYSDLLLCLGGAALQVTYRFSGDVDKAFNCLKIAEKMRPNFVFTLFNLGMSRHAVRVAWLMCSIGID